MAMLSSGNRTWSDDYAPEKATVVVKTGQAEPEVAFLLTECRPVHQVSA